MKTTVIVIEEKIDALLTCLDNDVQHLQKGILQLDELRRLVIKHDDDALSILLEEIQTEVDDYKRHERKRQSIWRELAAVLGYDLKQMTLSTLETILPKAITGRITEKKKQIRGLVEELRKEHVSTSMLLLECARINHTLLKGIFNHRKVESLCYNANGAAKRQTDVALIDLQL